MNPDEMEALKMAFQSGRVAIEGDVVALDFNNPRNLIMKPGETLRLPGLKPAGFTAVIGFVSTGSEWAIVVGSGRDADVPQSIPTADLVEWRKKHIG